MRLLTAQRGIEIQNIRWCDIDGDWWTIPTEVSKNNLPHRVFLAPQAQEILDNLEPLTGDSQWVFESPRKAGYPMVSMTKTTLRIVETAKIEKFTAHDFRRTAATHMASMGIDRFTIAKILNHQERGVTAIYDRASYDREKRSALTRWDRRLHQIITAKGKREKVVKMR
jgi:integrase